MPLQAFNKLEDKARKAMSARNARAGASCYRQLINQPGCPSQTLVDASQALLFIGERDEARDVLRRAKDSTGTSDMLVLQLAAGYFKAGDFQVANGLLTSAWERTGSDLFVVPLAETHERLGQLGEALRILDGIRTPSPRSFMIKGLVLARQDKPAEAQGLLSRARRAPNVDPLTAFRAGLEEARCYEKLGDYRKAWDTMTGARKKQFPRAAFANVLDKEYQTKTRLALSDTDDFAESFADHLRPPDDESPLLLAGHPRSGNSVIAVALSKALNRSQVDEPDAWTRTMEHLRMVRGSLGKIEGDTSRSVRDDYFRRIAQIDPAIAPGIPLIDKNPGLELSTARWLRAFPASMVVFVRRHPLDVVISCLFTYLRPNPVSLQYYTPGRAMASIRNSTLIQDKFLECAPDHCRAISYESFVANGTLPLEDLPRVSPDNQAAVRSVLNSPNYFQARKSVHADSVGRYENYLPFLPREVTAHTACLREH